MKKIPFTKNLQSGQAMLLAVLFFLSISLTVVLGIAAPILKQVKIAGDVVRSKASYYLAEGALEDGLYRLKNAKNIVSGDTIVVNGYTTTLTLTTTGTGKIIEATSNRGGIVRKMQAQVVQGAGIAFNYGLQAGNGGVTMDGGSSIDGNIYSNGSINAINATITGSAVAADSSALTSAQANDTPTTPSSSIVFRNSATTVDFAQSFELSSDALVTKVQFYIKKLGAPTDATVRIVADNNGSPSTTVLGSGTLSAGLITATYGWVDIVLTSPVALIADTPYWIVIDSTAQSGSVYFTVGANTLYSSGAAKTGVYAGTWTATSSDSYFRVYTGGISSQIGGATYAGGFSVGSSTTHIGDAWATTVKGTTAQGTIYCTTGLNNNKSCNTTKGSPAQQALPFSDANFQDWKDDAAAGGTITGNYTVGSAGATLGPKKITGNLLINGGGTLTLTGPLWVEGTVTITGGGKLKLPSTYAKNSETIISDSTISISGGGSVGSGTSGSYLFMVSTSQCPNDTNCGGLSAININGGAGAIAANAQSGNVALSGGAAINAVVGNTITITGGSTVTYDSGLASPSFSSGPSGGWSISSWKEVQ